MTWTQEQLLLSPTSFFNAICKTFDHAKTSIDIESYIFSFDSIGNQVLNHLSQAQKRGVHVRLLIDGIGSSDSVDILNSYCHTHQLSLRVHNPLPWPLSNFKLKKQPSQKTLSFLNGINRRNHRKLIVVDQAIAFVGGINITSSELLWKDIAVTLSGSPLQQLQHVFNKDWEKSTHSSNSSKKVKIKTPLNTNAFYILENRSLYSRLRSRRYRQRSIVNSKRIWASTGYFIPPPHIYKKLIATAQKNHDVKVFISHQSDHPILNKLSHYYCSLLAQKGVQIYLLKNSFLHAKCLLLDHNAILGSSNLNFRSSFLDLELDAVVSQPKTLNDLEKYFKDLQSESEQMTTQNIDKISLWDWIFIQLLWPIRFWL